MPISRKNGSTRSRNPRVSALVGLPVAVSPGLLDELLDPALAKPFEGGKVRLPVWDVAQAPGEPDGIPSIASEAPCPALGSVACATSPIRHTGSVGQLGNEGIS